MKSSEDYSCVCLSCGNRLFEAVLKDMVGVYASESEYEVLKCKTCELLTTHPRPNESQLFSIYSNDYAYSYHISVSKEKRSRARKLLRRIDKVVDLSKKSTFLELGCANGESSRILSKQYRLSGIGVDLNVPDQVRNESVNFVRQPICEYLEMSKEFFDIVLLSHTLEHLLDPSFSLKLIRERLNGNGDIVIVVPNTLAGRTKAWGYWQVPVHISHFNEISLKRLLHNCGFDPIYVGKASIDFLGLGLTVLNVLKIRKSPKQNRVVVILTSFFSLIWSLFYSLGNSDLIVVARKSESFRHSSD